MLDDLKNKYLKLGRIPLKRDIDEDPNMPGSYAYYSTFGGIGKALQLIGLAPNRIENLSLDMFINLAKDFYKETNKAPAVLDFDNTPGYPHSSYIRDTMNMSWNEFLTLCNLPTFSNGEIWIKNRKAELIAKSKLIESGHKVEDLSILNSNAPHSFIVDGIITVDVRYSSYILDNNGRNIFWKFKLHLGTKKEKPDYFIGVGFNNDDEFEKIFVFPTNELTVRESISINVERIHKSKYGKYLVEDMIDL